MNNKSDLLNKVNEIALKNFNIKQLYPNQRIVISNILESICDDSCTEEDTYLKGKQIVLLPTGAGKSLCFLIPALIIPGITLIIYPLLALMADQHRRMLDANISCVIFRGNQSIEERNNNFQKITDGAKIIIANPEVLQNNDLTDRLSKINISHIAIDEAHCVSEWGDTFRPSYLTLGKIIKKLKPKCVTAFTATASPTVLDRISQLLFENSAHIIQGETDRPNIHYSVVYADAKKKAILEQVIINQKPLIVFCPTRKITENIARFLQEYYKTKHNKGDLVKFYHAGLTKEEKDKVEKWFYPHNEGILVATCAFGMGVDKKDIRTVIHHTMPMTVESFIQEAGRGGRDKNLSKSIVIFSNKDKLQREKYSLTSREYIMLNYSLSTTCRRDILLKALNAKENTVCMGCDVCQNTNKNFAEDSKLVYNFIKNNRHSYTIDEAIEKLCDKANKQSILTYDYKLWTHEDFKEIILSLLKSNKLKICKFPWNNLLSINK